MASSLKATLCSDRPDIRATIPAECSAAPGQRDCRLPGERDALRTEIHAALSLAQMREVDTRGDAAPDDPTVVRRSRGRRPDSPSCGRRLRGSRPDTPERLATPRQRQCTRGRGRPGWCPPAARQAPAPASGGPRRCGRAATRSARSRRPAARRARHRSAADPLRPLSRPRRPALWPAPGTSRAPPAGCRARVRAGRAARAVGPLVERAARPPRRTPGSSRGGGPRGSKLTVLGQLLQAVLAERLQQPVPPLAALAVRSSSTCTSDLSTSETQQIERASSSPSIHCATRLGGLQGEAAGEDGQAAQQRLLRLGEQVVAPVDGAAQGLLAGQRRPAAAGQQAEAVVQAGGDLLHREGPDPRGGQLDRQRDAVQPGADLPDQRRVPLGQRERRATPPAPARRTAGRPRSRPSDGGGART